jgi:hypothetical protein
MRKIAWMVACLAVLLSALTVGLYRRYRIQPLPEHPFASASYHVKRVEKATSLYCNERAQYPDRPVLIQLVQKTTDTRPLISINQDETRTWTEARERLKSIYSTRAERLAFVVDNAEVDQLYRTELIDMLLLSSDVYDVCVIDSRNPPSWYPLLKIPMPAVAQR